MTTSQGATNHIMVMQDFTQKPAHKNDMLSFCPPSFLHGKFLHVEHVKICCCCHHCVDILAVMLPVGADWRQHLHQHLHRREINGTYACGGRRIESANARARREPAGQSQYMEKKRKREENDQKQTGAQNSVRPFCRSQKTFFAQSFAQKETGSSLLHKNYFLPKALLRKNPSDFRPYFSRVNPA